ncbi:MAG: hypothetical protein AB7I27_18645 [Bacteriovoracaceae bacterium]
MGLPLYNQINIKNSSIDDLKLLLTPEMNLKNPVVFNLKDVPYEGQREIIGLIENYFVTENISFDFPYPIYFISDHEKSISDITILDSVGELPKFYNQKEGKINVKESHLISRNKLLQIEIKNTDAEFSKKSLYVYAETHREIFDLEMQGTFYKSILHKLMKAKKNG